MQTFNTDKEIKEYIEKNIDSIKLLDECRLYKEEQLQITEEVMRVGRRIEGDINGKLFFQPFSH